MSIFDEPTPVVEQGKPAVGEQPNFLDQLVGDGKKFKTVEDLAKGKAESDSMIDAMKAENTELKTKQQEQDYAKNLLEQIKEKATVAPVSPEPMNKSTEGGGNTLPKPEDIESLIDGMLSKRDKVAIVQSNLGEVKTKLVELYGTEAQAKVTERAKALRVDVSYLDEMAAASPTSFFAIMGEAPKASHNPIISGAGGAPTGGTERDASFYYKMYKENKNLWKSPAMQAQMIKDKNDLGTRYSK